ncbi:MAG: methyltransferase domain-containing protein [Bacteroidota bacterium]
MSIKTKSINGVRSIKTRIRKMMGKSDIKRWTPISSLNENWDNRTKILASFISENSKVIEFGAGRLVLKNFIPESCEYTPSDIVDRGEGTIVLDLNTSPLLEFENYDYAVFSGVLEYVNDIPLLIRHLSKYMNSIILSYAVTDNHPKSRELHGWVNSYSESEIVSILNQNDYHVTERTTWGKQVIFVVESK